MKRSKLYLGAIISVAAMFAATAPATGHGGGDKARVKINKLKPSGASGIVKTSNECEKGRQVRVFMIEDFVSVKVQFDRTNSSGKWRIKKDLEPGVYFAKVDSTPGCDYAVSKNKRLR